MSNATGTSLLHDTIRYLEQQKDQGIRHLRISEGLLKGWDAKISPGSSSRTSLPVSTASSANKKAMTSERLTAFEAFKNIVLQCQKCPHLVSFRKQVVFGVGNPDAELMFVGEAPGADEDEQGEPFVGKAGQLLTKMIQAMGFQRSDIYIGNVLKCRPNVDTPTGNRKPTPEEMATCIPYLKEQIKFIQPRVLVAVGDTAVKGLLPDLKEGITKLRGKWLEFDGIPLMPTFHPSYLLRNQSLALRRQCWEDMLAVLEKLEKPVSEKQKNYFKTA